MPDVNTASLPETRCAYCGFQLRATVPVLTPLGWMHRACAAAAEDEAFPMSPV